MDDLNVLHPNIQKSVYIKQLHELIFRGHGPPPHILEKMAEKIAKQKKLEAKAEVAFLKKLINLKFPPELLLKKFNIGNGAFIEARL